tara:strand:+ start:6538 stop:6765 length:228 start_codon:yes stop_codon:yes gene_type:complete
MVYSQTNKTASIASITNQNQGGGSKKAGLPHLIARDAFASIHLKNTSQRLSVLKMPLVSTVSQSRPIGTRPSAYP